MDATSANFAVSSLCAATASCSAGAVGLTWATNGEATSSTSFSTHAAPASFRPSTSLSRSASRKSFLSRPKSAIITWSRDNPWAPASSSAAAGAVQRPAQPSSTPAESLQETEEGEATPSDSIGPLPRRRSTWFRRRLTLTPSPGQSSTETDRPSTPSTFTNASNTPFFPTSAPSIASRNRLVKRSTSQSFGNSNSLESTPFRPTFRRPATSHQRSAESRINAARAQHYGRSPTPQAGGQDRASVESSLPRPNQWKWEPFFQRHTIRVREISDTPLKSPTNRFSSGRDEISCVRGPSGSLPTLVMAASITAQINVEREYATPTQARDIQYQSYQSYPDPRPVAQTRRMSQFREEFPEPSPNTSEREPRISSSYSLSSLLPSPTPAAFKVIRRRGSRKNETGSASLTSNQRHVSDGNVLAGRGIGNDSPSNHPQATETNERARVADDHHLNHVRSASDISIAFHGKGPAGSDGPDHALIYPRTRDSSRRSHRYSFSGSTEPVRTSSALSSNTPSHARYSRGSRVVSDHGSTVLGSDTDNSRIFSVSGDETDISEVNYDSIRTGGTSSSQSALRSTRIENVFDDPGRDFLHSDGLSVLEEKLSDTSISSSGKLGGTEAHNESGLASVQASPHLPLARLDSPSHPQTTSTPPSLSSPPLALVTLAPGMPFADLEDDGEDREALWEIPEEDAELSVSHLNLDDSPRRPLAGQQEAQLFTTPEPTKKVDLWKWSEKSQDDEARPKTVHGKTQVNRGIRAGSRRPNIHARSQSVPNVTENSKSRFNDAAKLDAWTLGGKGASEDWDDDFDVDELEKEPEASVPSSTGTDGRDLRSSGFYVPPTILAKQSSVHGQFSQVKELTLLVEELRRLQRRADDLGVREGQASALWVEAEGIIDLATLEEDEDLAPPAAVRPGSPTSTDFDFDAAEERVATPASARLSSFAVEDTPSRASPGQHLRGAGASRASPSLTPRSMSHGNNVVAGTPPTTRPRQNSTAQAKTVLEHLHHYRLDGTNTVTPSTPSRTEMVNGTQSRSQKQPFDTQSLKDLVTRAGVVTRALKEIVRYAEEGTELPLPETPDQLKGRGSSLGIVSIDARSDPLFSQIFQHPGPISTPPSQRRSPLFKRDREGQGTPSGNGGGSEDIAVNTPSRAIRSLEDFYIDEKLNDPDSDWQRNPAIIM